GTFTSLDAVAGSAQDPLSMNRYLYAEANPATFIDPTGHCTKWIDDICADHRNGTNAVQKQHWKKYKQAEAGRRRSGASKPGGTWTAPRTTPRTTAADEAARDIRESLGILSRGTTVWAPPSLDYYNGLGGDRAAYMLDHGRDALAWLSANSDSDAILNNPSAYYIANDYAYALDRAMGSLDAARSGHPESISVNPNAGLDPNGYMTGDRFIAWAQQSHADPATAWAFGTVASATYGASDGSNGLAEGPQLGGGIRDSGYQSISASATTVVAPTRPTAPDFVVDTNGVAYPVPQGASGPRPTRTGKGITFEGGAGGNGLDPRVDGVRIMDPRTSGKYQYPNGYVSYFNHYGQAVNPYTGSTLSRGDPWWHIPL
ncbi:MAG TPA: hypothetical protein VFJ71_13325, partial [Candidatus Limnocylindrales bacterium]|nr:hypothetical protein [Candidatus Limnocylindrales bacterium]